MLNRVNLVKQMSINNDNNKQIAKELFRLAGNTAGNLFAGIVIVVCVMTLLSALVAVIQEWVW